MQSNTMIVDNSSYINIPLHPGVRGGNMGVSGN